MWYINYMKVAKPFNLSRLLFMTWMWTFIWLIWFNLKTGWTLGCDGQHITVYPKRYFWCKRLYSNIMLGILPEVPEISLRKKFWLQDVGISTLSFTSVTTIKENRTSSVEYTSTLYSVNVWNLTFSFYPLSMSLHSHICSDLGDIVWAFWVLCVYCPIIQIRIYNLPFGYCVSSTVPYMTSSLSRVYNHIWAFFSQNWWTYVSKCQNWPGVLLMDYFFFRLLSCSFFLNFCFLLL